ncbi:hypothetical protein [Clostridium sp.]|uniref:hypothetical protein n=1 Tax=Clostridium sp. TaxID=1506 RepID=UPI0032176A36
MRKKKVGLFLGLALALTLVLSSNMLNLNNYAVRDSDTLQPILGKSDPGTLPL